MGFTQSNKLRVTVRSPQSSVRTVRNRHCMTIIIICLFILLSFAAERTWYCADWNRDKQVYFEILLAVSRQYRLLARPFLFYLYISDGHQFVSSIRRIKKLFMCVKCSIHSFIVSTIAGHNHNSNKITCVDVSTFS